METRARWYESNVSLTEQLALYETFHRDRWNRRLHYGTIPLILWSGFTIAATITPPLGLAIYALAALCFLTLDRLATLLVCGWVLPLLLVAEHIAERCGSAPALAGGLAVQLACWYVSVGIGHERCEPALEMGSQRVSSNVYLERRMFRLENVGRRPSALAASVQFLIAPFHMTMQGLFRLGYRPALLPTGDRTHSVS
jgi:uncharacterized membrane protein YGL010W